MGVDELTEDPLPVDEDVTVEEMVEHFGREATRRGLQYMMGLLNADRAYRNSADKRKLKKGLSEGYDVEEAEGERVDQASSNWEKTMEEKGLGLWEDE